VIIFGSAATKFADRERHLGEQRAGILFICYHANLVGNAVFGCLNHILAGAFNAENREETEGNCEDSLAIHSA